MADALMAVTRHQRMSLPSASIIDSVLVPFRVAGGSPGWRVAGLAAAQRETGDRMINWGRNTFRSQVSAIRSLVRVFRCRFGFGSSVIVPFQVAGDSHRSQPSRFRPSGFRLLASGYRLLMAGMPSPEWLMP